MLGGYDESAVGSPLGAPVSLLEESGEKVIRTPNSQDIVATVIRAFGLEPGKDFFIPGGTASSRERSCRPDARVDARPRRPARRRRQLRP